MNTYDVTLRQRDKPGSRGYQCEVIFAGEVIAISRDPEYAACRALLANGLVGRVRFWSDVYGPQRDYRSSLDIERGAKSSTSESSRSSLRVAKYNDHWRQEDGEEEAPELEIAA